MVRRMAQLPEPEEQVDAGTSIDDISRLRAEMQSVAQQTEQIQLRFDNVRYFVSLLEDPLVQKIIRRRSLETFLSALWTARTKRHSFVKLATSLGADCSLEPIGCADFCYAKLTADDIATFGCQLRGIGQSIERLEQRMMQETEEAMTAIRQKAECLIHRIDINSATIRQSISRLAFEQPPRENGNGSHAPFSLAQEARALFQQLCLLPGDPEAPAHCHNKKKRNSGHVKKYQQK